MPLVKHCIFSLGLFFALAVSFVQSAYAGEDKLLPETECVRHCELLGYTREQCYETCPKFRYQGSYIRDTKRYYIYRDCVRECIIKEEANHFYMCATQRCRVKDY